VDSIAVAIVRLKTPLALPADSAAAQFALRRAQRGGRGDIVITSTGTPDCIFSGEDGRELMRLRKNRPLFFVDIAVHEDVDPEINRVEVLCV